MLASLVGWLLAATALAQPAPNAQPEGGTVLGGDATIGATASGVTVDQASESAVVQWRSFDVGAIQEVTFTQPVSPAAVLNQIVSPDPSRIAGSMTSDGQLYLYNPTGFILHKGSEITTGGSFALSTVFLSTANFMAGQRTFDGTRAPGSASTLARSRSISGPAGIRRSSPRP